MRTIDIAIILGIVFNLTLPVIFGDSIHLHSVIGWGLALSFFIKIATT